MPCAGALFAVVLQPGACVGRRGPPKPRKNAPHAWNARGALDVERGDDALREGGAARVHERVGDRGEGDDVALPTGRP